MTTTDKIATLRIPRPIRLIYAFIKWIAVAISLTLLIIGLILGLPWKILLLLAVIPTVGIFMPRDLQKWCWMVMAIVAIAVYLWIHSPEQNASQWRPFVFEQKITEYLRKGQIPDPQNAALRYEELFNRHEEDVFARPVDEDTELATYLQPWEEIDQPELTQWMKILDPEITVLVNIAATPECRFMPPVDMKTLNDQFKRLNILKTLTRILIRSANQDIHKDLYPNALQKKLAVLQMTQHLWMQKTLLDQAAGYFLERIPCPKSNRPISN
jgi:hypothetical protein